MSGSRAAKRHQLADKWGRYYPQPLAELIAVVVQPLDDDDTALAEVTVEARKAARREVKELFALNQARPSGGQIEAPLREIAIGLLDVIQANEGASLPAERLALAIAQLGDVGPTRGRRVVGDELVVPEAAKRLEGDVPFAMWR